MKKSSFIIIFLISLHFIGFSQYKYNPFPEKQYKVTKIIKIKKAFIIDVIDVSNYKRYTIISLRNTNDKKGIKIRKGNCYNFILYPYYDPKFIYTSDLGYTHKITIDDIQIFIKENLRHGLFTLSPNLNGLYYIRCK